MWFVFLIIIKGVDILVFKDYLYYFFGSFLYIKKYKTGIIDMKGNK